MLSYHPSCLVLPKDHLHSFCQRAKDGVNEMPPQVLPDRYELGVVKLDLDDMLLQKEQTIVVTIEYSKQWYQCLSKGNTKKEATRVQTQPNLVST